MVIGRKTAISCRDSVLRLSLDFIGVLAMIYNIMGKRFGGLSEPEARFLESVSLSSCSLIFLIK
ncbi:hypothetical protein LEP1GSC071_1915 [Leptospira santarosai str. JET]|nr:hypothetical protein LEP1GSC071_1915 [Leptospira santarosai str. JET]